MPAQQAVLGHDQEGRQELTRVASSENGGRKRRKEDRLGVELGKRCAKAIEVSARTDLGLLEAKKVFLSRALDGLHVDRRIKGDELSTAPNGEREEVEISDLSRSMDMCRDTDLRIEQAEVIGPEFVKCACARFRKAFHNR